MRQGPVLEILGTSVARQKWRVIGYVVEATCEVAIVGGSMILASRELTVGVFFVNFLALPVVVGALRIGVAAMLVRSYVRIERADAATAYRLINGVHASGCWLCSATSLPVFSALLAMWHGFGFLLMLCYGGDKREASTVGVLSAIAFVCMTVNGCLWYSGAKLIKDLPDRPITQERVPRRYYVERTVKSAPVRLAPYRALVAEAESGCIQNLKSCRVVPSRSLLPESCVVCLEEFTQEETLAQLACGHIFHPVCLEKWLREGWRCPYRCSDKDDDACRDEERGAASRRPDDAASWAWL
mmetsp:Transcript_19457/g.52091  ORF Transcript_19457/g.52091 Transcript_19457/m.52091 type:complete len:299 (-) Transcript_19457:93-989(-)